MRRAVLACVLLAGCAQPSTPRLVEAGGVPVEVMNGLALNGSPLIRLTAAPLSTAGLASNTEIQSLAADPGVAKLMKYLVECALPETTSIAIRTSSTSTLTIAGAIGLAPEWESGPCDQACQEWVSACLYARTNAFGLPVRIYLSGDHPAFGADEPQPGYSVQEGAFYGNYFLDQPREYTCRGSGFDPLYQSIRVCTQHGKGCGFTRVGACRGIDGDTGLPADRHACDRESPTGLLGDCWSRATLPGEDRHPEPAVKYTRVITIRVRDSIFAPGMSATGFGSAGGPIACGDAPPDLSPVDPDPDPGPAVAGVRCVTDDACDNEALICDNRGPVPYCTNYCESTPDAITEQTACGSPESTCLAFGPGSAFCTQACDPAGTGPRRCRAGAVCTRYWIYQSDQTAGCYNFCSSDADCGGLTCHPRIGACGVPYDPSLLPDGSPCDPTSAEEQCRGTCFPVGMMASEGLCGSVVNRAITPRCSDFTLTRMQPVAPGNPGTEDDMGLCVYRFCAQASECPAPLTCKSGVLAGRNVCTY